MKITRARDYRLYYGDLHQRILDMELDGGRALFGHSPRGLAKAYKNSISRGLYCGFDSAMHRTAVRLLKELFPGYGALIFPDRRSAGEFLAHNIELSLDESEYQRFIPAPGSGPSVQAVEMWRPFTDRARGEILLPIIPQPGAISPQPLLYKKEPRQEEKPGTGDPAAPSSGFRQKHRRFILNEKLPCSQFQLSGLVQVLSLMLQARTFSCFGSTPKLIHQPKKHQQALGRTRQWFSDDLWSRIIQTDNPIWSRTGPYIFPKAGHQLPAAEWEGFRAKATALGIRLPESPDSVIIIPSMFSQREEQAMRELFSSPEAADV